MQRLGFALTATMKRKKTNEERTFSEASQQTDDRMTLAAVLLVLSQRELHTCESKPHVKPASLYCRLTRVRFFPSCFVAAVSKHERLLQALQPQTEKKTKKNWNDAVWPNGLPASAPPQRLQRYKSTLPSAMELPISGCGSRGAVGFRL